MSDLSTLAADAAPLDVLLVDAALGPLRRFQPDLSTARWALSLARTPRNTARRIGDLGAFVRSQGDAHFDVLASDERPDVTGVIHAKDFAEVHSLLERFYRLILVDTHVGR